LIKPEDAQNRKLSLSGPIQAYAGRLIELLGNKKFQLETMEIVDFALFA
jgi:hypothetical protein